jgi:hypothetical protein
MKATVVDGLLLPSRLMNLLATGAWPQTPEEGIKQNLQSRVPKNRIQVFAPEEDEI